MNKIIGFILGIILFSSATSCVLLYIFVTHPLDVKNEKVCNDKWSFSNHTTCSGDNCHLIEKDTKAGEPFEWDCAYKKFSWSVVLLPFSLILVLASISVISAGLVQDCACTQGNFDEGKNKEHEIQPREHYLLHPVPPDSRSEF